MKIRQLIIENFRGIKKLDWKPEDDNIVCLVGHGDSSKSTILRAIDYVLYPKWNLKIRDTDFYLCDPVKNKIVIRIVIGELSAYLEGSGDLIFHWNKEKGEFCDLLEKENDNSGFVEPVFVIELTIDDTLEPKWTLKGESDLDEELSTKRRNSFNLIRLDNSGERNFQWKYNTLLTKLTESGYDKDVRSLLSDAGRSARSSFDTSKLPDHLKNSSEMISNEARIFGAGHNGLIPNIDVFCPDALCLHDSNNVPIYMLGEGSKKLLLLSMEKILLKLGKEKNDQHLVLMDEIERGLEPHRLRHLILILRRMMEQYNSQAIIATHSPTTIVEIGGFGVYRVRNENGEVKVEKVSDASKIRTEPEGFFINDVILCEGNTELGIMRAFKEEWMKKHSQAVEHKGAYFIRAHGSEMKHYADSYKESLGYRVCVYRDSDTKVKLPSEIKDVFEYDGSINIEQAICKDAPFDLVREIIDFCKTNDFEGIPEINENNFSAENREALASFLHDCNGGKGAFRNIGDAEELGKMILKYSGSFPNGSTLINTINNIEKWIYGNGAEKS